MKNKIIVTLFIISMIFGASEGNVTNPQDTDIWINFVGLIARILLLNSILKIINEINKNI